MWNDLVYSPLFGIGLTLGVFALAQACYRRTGWLVLHPVSTTIAAVMAILLALDVPYEAYARGGDMILFLLGPSVVALAVPLYQRRSEILARKVPILVGVLAGAVSSVVTACGLGWLLGGSRDVVLSLAPKSVTTPIAIGLVETLGGIAPLTAAIVVLTGCIGALCGPEFCRLAGIASPSASGLAVGTASHGIGTARMLEVDRLAGATAGLAIGLNGLITAVILPLFRPLLP